MHVETTANRELAVLSYIEHKSQATQRELSEHIGVSLGSVNLLLKKLVSKGLVKIERLQPNSVKYFLTPAGIVSKLERTYGYAMRTYRELLLLRSQISEALSLLIDQHSRDRVFFFGPKDDFSLLLAEVLQAEYQLPQSRVFSEQKKLAKAIENKPNSIVFTWSNQSTTSLQSFNIVPVNLLERICVLDGLVRE